MNGPTEKDCGLGDTEYDPFHITRDLLHRALGWHEGLGAVGDWPQVVGQAQQIIDQVLNVPVVLDELHRRRAAITTTRKIVPRDWRGGA